MTMMFQEGPWFDGFEGVPELDADGVARAGEPLPAGTPVASEAALIEAASTVYDPEIPINIYDLGLIYAIEPNADGLVKVEMTLTAPGCPVAGVLPGKVAQVLAAVDGVGEVEVRLTWDPPWDMSMMSEAARVELDMW
jgi:FeS assembly SUF system protein